MSNSLQQGKIKKLLLNHGISVWQLIRQLKISHQTYYSYSHENFKGHEDEVRNAIDKLIKNKKASE